MQRARVLLADDREEFLAVEFRLLEPEFEAIATVAGGWAVIEQAARFGPEALILDIGMPGFDGIEVARRLRAAGSLAKINFRFISEETRREFAKRHGLTP